MVEHCIKPMLLSVYLTFRLFHMLYTNKTVYISLWVWILDVDFGLPKIGLLEFAKKKKKRSAR